MAIIKGVTSAKVSEVTPYVEDITSMKEGIVARDTRANELRDMIAKSKAAMLKQTRDHNDDFELAQQLEKGFSTDVSSMVDAADRDYSSINRDQFQTLATEWAGKTDFRILSEAKRNADEAIMIKQKIESANGTVSYFGDPTYNPLSGSLRLDDGSARKFTGNWGMEKTLDHSQAAKRLFDEIGKTISGKSWYAKDPNFTKLPDKKLADGTSVPDWVAYWQKHSKKDSDNWTQVDHIIKGALDGFIKDSEGSQYYRLQKDHALYKLGKSEQEAIDYARQKTQDLIFTYGQSEKTDLHTTDVTRQKMAQNSDQAERPAKSGNNGAGTDTESRPPVVRTYTSSISSHGVDGTKSQESDMIDKYRNIHAEADLVGVTADLQTDGFSYTTIDNNHALVNSVMSTTNRGEGGGTADIPEGEGELQSLGAVGEDYKSNSAVIFFKKNDKTKGWENTTTANYENFDAKDGMIKLPGEPDENGNPTFETKSAETLVEQLGDDLFLRSELVTASEGLEDVMKNDLAWSATVAGDGSKGDKSLSTFSVNRYDGEITINPLLYNLEELYTKKLADVNPGGATKILYEAKLLKIQSKIENAKKLQARKAAKFDGITKKVLLNNEHAKILKENFVAIGQQFGFGIETVEEIIEGTEGEESSKFKTNVIESTKKASEVIGLTSLIDNMIAENDANLTKDGNGDLLFTEEESKNHILKLKTIWANHREKIVKGEYKSSDLGPHEVGVDRKHQGLRYGLSAPLKDEIDKDPELTKFLQTYTGNNPLFNSKNHAKLYHSILVESKAFDPPYERGTAGDATPHSYSIKNGYAILNEDVIKNYKTTYKTELSNRFNTQVGDIEGFVDAVESMNDIIENTSVTLYRTSTANTKDAEYAEKTKEEKQIMGSRGMLGDERTTRRAANFRNSKDENFQEQHLKNQIEKQWETLKEDGKTMSYQDYEKTELDKAYKGIRYEADELGGLMVAHYEYIDENNKKWFFEHDAPLDKYSAVKFFGVPMQYYTTGKQLKDGLKKNRRLYADIDNYGNHPQTRVHKANANIGKGESQVKNGQYYVLYKGNSLGEDPNAGSVDYGINEEGISRHAFETVDDFFAYQDKKYPRERQVSESLVNQITQLDNGADVEYVFPKGSIFRDKTKYPTPQSVRNALNSMLEKTLTGGTTVTGGKINASSTIEDLTTTGVVSKNNETGFYQIDVTTFDNMNIEDQANLGLKFNEELVNETWYTDTDGHKYLTDPKNLVDITNLNNIRSQSKMKATPAIQTFIKNTDDLLSSIINGNIPQNMKPTDFKMFQGLSSNDKMILTSVLRSLQDNTRAYRNRLDELTRSPHMRGNSVDIKTSGEAGRVGKALWGFFNTYSGNMFLKENGMNALYHDAGTGLHIDVSVATESRPAGETIDHSQKDKS